MRIEKQDLLTEPNVLTLAEAKEHLRLTTSEQDDYVKSLIIAAEDHISELTGVVLRQKRYKFYISTRAIMPALSTSWKSTFEIPVTPASLELVGYYPSDGTAFVTLVAGTDYTVIDRDGKLKVMFSTTPMVEDDSIRIDVIAGYGAPVSDPQTKLVMKMLVAHLFHNMLPASDVQLWKVPWALGVMLGNLKLSQTAVDVGPISPIPGMRVFYVSPSFLLGVSPLFSTIQAAVNACDGVVPTVVKVYPGVYVENVITKPFVWVIGLQKYSVIVEPTTGAAFTYDPPNINPAGIENLTIIGDNVNVTGVAISQNISAWTFRIRDVHFDMINGTAIHDVNSTSLSTLEIERCYFRAAAGFGVKLFKPGGHIKDCLFSSTSGSTVHIYLTETPSPFKFVVKDSRFFASTTTTFHIKMAQGSGGLYVEGCHFECNLNGYVFQDADTFGNQGSIYFVNCSLYQGRLAQWMTVTGQPGSLVRWSGGSMRRITRIAVSTTGWATVEIDNAAIEFSGSTQTLLFDTEKSTVRLFNCVVTQGTHSPLLNTSLVTFVNVVWKDGADFAPTQVGSPMFFGNFSTTKALASANITQAPGSFNVQTSLILL